MSATKLLCVLFVLPFAQAGTFLSGSVRWATTGENQAQFDVGTYWRRSFSPFNNGNSIPGSDVDIIAQSTVSFQFGDGSPEIYMLGHVTEINEADDWLEAVSTFTHTYPSSTAPSSPGRQASKAAAASWAMKRRATTPAVTLL
mmetsp:Transcript_10020/g.20452  ORF Transcript_10020/g.20452 Transcript_10020/m.20452 type:complete len:143 (-) Transcript_10020:468-896(-)